MYLTACGTHNNKYQCEKSKIVAFEGEDVVIIIRPTFVLNFIKRIYIYFVGAKHFANITTQAELIVAGLLASQTSDNKTDVSRSYFRFYNKEAITSNQWNFLKDMKLLICIYHYYTQNLQFSPS